MEPRYSTKTRAKRIEPEYFKRLHPFRRWRLILSITVPVVAAAWLVAYAARGDQRIYTSGPLSTGHAMFGTQCADCHGPGRAAAPGGTPTSAFFVRVSDRACLACHDAPVHHESQAFDPRCARCHVEHKGDVVLAALPDAQCSQCHADLTRMSRTPPTVAPRIRDFGSSHPEFAVAVKEQNVVRRVPLNRSAELKDLAQVKLNHQKHLKVGLKGLDELRTLKGPFRILERAGGLQLACAFCHQPEASRAAVAHRARAGRRRRRIDRVEAAWAGPSRPSQRPRTGRAEVAWAGPPTPRRRRRRRGPRAHRRWSGRRRSSRAPSA